MLLGQLCFYLQKYKARPFFHTIHKHNFKTDRPTYKAKTIQFLEKYMQVNLYYFRLGQAFEMCCQKHKQQKKNIQIGDH